jgi:hypothetical protein
MQGAFNVASRSICGFNAKFMVVMVVALSHNQYMKKFYILVDDSLLGAANSGLLLLLLGNLGALRLDLTGTSEGTVNFTLNFREQS